MQVPFLRDLWRRDWIDIKNNTKIHDLGPVLPFGVTLIAPAHQDAPLLHLASRLHQALGGALGATGHALPPAESLALLPSGQVRLAVVGAHLSGLPLNDQLTERGARLVAATHTAARYRLYALPDGKRPGLVQVEAGGAAIACEVWELPAAHFGSFVASIPAPLGIGKVTLADGAAVTGRTSTCWNCPASGSKATPISASCPFSPSPRRKTSGPAAPAMCRIAPSPIIRTWRASKSMPAVPPPW
jgi:hypothetical protein